jgi:hypothetical protein
MGDPQLAERMRQFKVKAPVEKIIATDLLATALNRDTLGDDLCKRIVDLACGHKAVTRNATSCQCSICHEMILNGEDYEAWRSQRP